MYGRLAEEAFLGGVVVFRPAFTGMWGMQGDYVIQGNDQWGNGKILLLPTVIVNKHQYRGRLDVPSILRALCAGFSETTEPEVGLRHRTNLRTSQWPRMQHWRLLVCIPSGRIVRS